MAIFEEITEEIQVMCVKDRRTKQLFISGDGLYRLFNELSTAEDITREEANGLILARTIVNMLRMEK